MGQDLFKHLPSEIKINILLRLPVVTTVCCKCVCKPWLALIESPEFMESHLSKSVPGLAVFRDQYHGVHPWITLCEFFEFVDEDNVHRCSAVFDFDLPDYEHIQSSVNGLLFLSDSKTSPKDLFVCNPITRDYIELPRPCVPTSGRYHLCRQTSYGFGVSKLSGQYKVVMIFHQLYRLKAVCHVYTLGAGSWRSFSPSGPQEYDYAYEEDSLAYDDSTGTFLNGNLHWLIDDQSNDSLWISCFDLETELFSTFTPPRLGGMISVLASLEECLVFCDKLSNDKDETVFWFMDKYGDGQSWTKKYIISSKDCYGVIKHDVLRPLKVFKDGDILISQWDDSKIGYSKKPTAALDSKRADSDVVELYADDRICCISYTPSFLSLNTFTMENVWSF